MKVAIYIVIFFILLFSCSNSNDNLYENSIYSGVSNFLKDSLEIKVRESLNDSRINELKVYGKFNIPFLEKRFFNPASKYTDIKDSLNKDIFLFEETIWISYTNSLGGKIEESITLKFKVRKIQNNFIVNFLGFNTPESIPEFSRYFWSIFMIIVFSIFAIFLSRQLLRIKSKYKVIYLTINILLFVTVLLYSCFILFIYFANIKVCIYGICIYLILAFFIRILFLKYSSNQLHGKTFN